VPPPQAAVMSVALNRAITDDLAAIPGPLRVADSVDHGLAGQPRNPGTHQGAMSRAPQAEAVAKAVASAREPE